MRTKIRTKEIMCGDFLHVHIMPVLAPARSTRKKSFNPTRESMVAYNEERSKKYLEELTEANFTNKDFIIHLTYHNDYLPQTDEEAQNQIELYNRRVQYHCRKRGLPPPVALWNTERGKINGRYHHHMYLKCELSRDEIEKIWGMGRCEIDNLKFDENGLTGLSIYVQKFNCRVGVRRWHSTNNLKKPIQHENDRMSKKQFHELAENLELSEYFTKQYKGYYLNRDSVKLYRNDVNGCEYLYFKLYRADSQYINSYLRKSNIRKLGNYRKKKDSRPRTSRPPNNVKVQ